MALNANVLGALMVTKLEEQFPRGFNKTQRDEIEKFSVAMAEAIISHFTDDAQIAITTTVTTPVTSGTSLQRLPTTIIAGEPTIGPASTVNLPGTGTGTAVIT